MKNRIRGKNILIGSLSITSVIVLVIGSMFSSLFIPPDNDKNIRKINLDKKWDIIVPDDFNTIQKAIDNAKKGDHIFVKNGVYLDPLKIKKSDIVIFGENKNNTLITVQYTKTSIVFYGDNITFSGFTIKNKEVNSTLINIIGDNNLIDNNILKIKDFIDGIEYGIRLDGAYNNTISNNYIIDGDVGIELSYSDNNIFYHNLLEKNDRAINAGETLLINLSRQLTKKIYYEACKNNQFIENIVRENRFGISVYGSMDDSFINNTFVSNNKHGLSLTTCLNSKVSKNKFVKDGFSLYGSKIDHFLHEITDNTVNGKPLCYIKNTSNYNVPSNTGQIIVVNCDNINIENAKISNTSTAVLIVFSRYVSISYCEFKSNIRGVFLYYSAYCRVKYNNFINNTYHAGFISQGFFNSKSNKWSRNYWSRIHSSKPRLFRFRPKKVSGRFYSNRIFRNNKNFRIAWITKNYDWLPVRHPYDIV